MRYNKLGSTGLFVSELCFGTMTFGGSGLYSNVGKVQQAETDALLARAFDAGSTASIPPIRTQPAIRSGSRDRL